MANSIAFAQAFAKQMDKKIMDSAVTAFFADNAMNAKFTSAKTVNIPKKTLVGLGNYSGSFPAADTTVAFTSYTLAMDRARELKLDRIAAEQTGIGNLAGEIGRDYIDEEVAPEMDAYCLSKLAAYANTNSQNPASASTSSPLAAMNKMLNNVQDALKYGEECVFFINPAFKTALEGSSEYTKYIGVDNFKKGAVSTKVKVYNDTPILPVKSGLMKTSFTFDAGSTASAGGFTPTVASGSGGTAVAAAKDVYAICVPKKAVMFCKRLQVVKIFAPNINQTGDDWKIQVRVVYDYFIKDNYKTGVQAFCAS